MNVIVVSSWELVAWLEYNAVLGSVSIDVRLSPPFKPHPQHHWCHKQMFSAAVTESEGEMFSI